MQRGAGRRADRIRGAEIGEAHAFGGEPVEVRRANLRAVAAQVAIAEIVTEDENNVGRLAPERRAIVSRGPLPADARKSRRVMFALCHQIGQ